MQVRAECLSQSCGSGGGAAWSASLAAAFAFAFALALGIAGVATARPLACAFGAAQT